MKKFATLNVNTEEGQSRNNNPFNSKVLNHAQTEMQSQKNFTTNQTTPSNNNEKRILLKPWFGSGTIKKTDKAAQLFSQTMGSSTS